MRDILALLSFFFDRLYWITYRPKHWWSGEGDHLFDLQNRCKICNKLKEEL